MLLCTVFLAVIPSEPIRKHPALGRIPRMQNSLASPPVTATWRTVPRVCPASSLRSFRTVHIICQCEHRDSAVISVQPSRSRESLSSVSGHTQVRCVRPDPLSAPLASILLPLAAAFAVLLGYPVSVEAGILSGLESFQVPSLPTPETLKKIQEANVEKYKAFDANFKKSPFLQGLLKKSKENKEMHRKEIEDKYCERGAEWGVGDCSLIGLPQADKDAFYEKLKEGKKGN